MDKDFTIGGVFENAQKIIDTVEYNYKTGGGSKVSDITSGNIRMAKFVGNPYGKSQLMFNGNKSIEFSTQKCAGGFIPFDEIVSTFKFINNGDSPTKSDDKSTSIKVLSPNGGEVWKIGNTYNISFAVNGNIGSRTVSLNRYSDDGVKVNSKVIGIVEVNSVVYKIPSDTVETRGDAGRYKIEVSSSDKYQDVSDNYFTIIN